MGTVFTPDFSAEGLALPVIPGGERLYKRKFSLLAGDNAGNALDLSALHIRFTVTSACTQTPRRLDVRIYNPAPMTARRIQQEFTQIAVSAGYQTGPFGVIFTGSICQTRYGRENATDTYIDIAAADGDVAYTQSTINTKLDPPWTWQQVLDTLVASLKGGVTLGSAPPFNDAPGIRPKVLYGATRDHLREFGKANGVDWSIENGKLNLISRYGYLPGEALVLNAASGMIGVPEQTIDGVNVRMLLNPNCKTGRLLQINNASITQTSFRAPIGLDASRLPDVDRDGLYKVYSLRIDGDTLGQAWYTNAICAAINPTGSGIAVSSSPYINAVINGQ